MPSYGSVAEKPAPDARDWQSRGTVFGILVALLSSAGSTVLCVATMYLNVAAMSKEVLLNCHNTRFGRHLPEYDGFVLFCEYLEAYVTGFPEMCLVALILFVGREILHKRLYYGMLKAGGVLDYHRSVALKDPIVLLLLWCYVHVIAYTLLVLYLGQFGFLDVLEEEATVRALVEQREVGEAAIKLHTGKSPELVKIFVDLFSYILLPGIFFLVFFYFSYSIEGGLVPLSEYVGDAEKVLHGHDDLAGLLVLDEAVTRQVIETEAIPEENSVEEVYALTIERYRLRQKAPVEDGSVLESPPMTLFTCFWPVRVLLLHSTQGRGLITPHHTSFRWLWWIFWWIAMAIYFPMAIVLLIRAVESAMEGHFLNHIVGLLHLAVVLIASGILVAGTVPVWQQMGVPFPKSCIRDGGGPGAAKPP